MTPEVGGGDLGYAAALEELERILLELEDEAVDVDVLADRVRRAAELLRVCRQRLGSARVEVERVVAELESDEQRQPPSPAGPVG